MQNGALAKKLGKWDRQATIRRFRDTNCERRGVMAWGWSDVNSTLPDWM